MCKMKSTSALLFSFAFQTFAVPFGTDTIKESSLVDIESRQNASNGPIVNQGTINLIESVEGFTTNFVNVDGHPTIGFGHDCTEQKDCGSIHAPLSREEGTQLLQKDLGQFIPCVSRLPNCNKLNANQFGALTSFAFNSGCGNLAKFFNTRMQQNNPTATCNALSTTNTLGGELSSRRRKEAAFCNSPTDQPANCNGTTSTASGTTSGPSGQSSNKAGAGGGGGKKGGTKGGSNGGKSGGGGKSATSQNPSSSAAATTSGGGSAATSGAASASDSAASSGSGVAATSIAAASDTGAVASNSGAAASETGADPTAAASQTGADPTAAASQTGADPTAVATNAGAEATAAASSDPALVSEQPAIASDEPAVASNLDGGAAPVATPGLFRVRRIEPYIPRWM